MGLEETLGYDAGENRAGQFTGLADRTVAAQPVFHCVGIQVLSLNLNLSPFVIINYICIYSPVDVTIYRHFDFLWQFKFQFNLSWSKEVLKGPLS